MWLKSLRLHKYASLFSQITYDEMMTLSEHHLESQVNRSAHTYMHVYTHARTHTQCVALVVQKNNELRPMAIFQNMSLNS